MLTKRALLGVLLAVTLPMVNACKELDKLYASDSSDPDSSVAAEAPEQAEPEAPEFQPIQINAAPADLMGYPGQTATFAVTASSEASLSYQWYHNDVALAGATAPSLSFTIAAASDAGTYKVEISNPTESVNTAARLIVNGLPEITKEPADVAVYPGGTARFSVGANGDDLEYQWESRGLTGWTTLDATGDTLVVDNVSTSTRKQYRVKVKNGGGQKVSRTSRINLKSPVVITSNPESQLVSAGDTVSFWVAASGHGNLAYQWYKAGSALSDNGKFQGARSPRLVVQNVSAADASLYYAIVSNQDNLTARSSAAELSVRGPVSVTVQPSDISLYAGQGGELVIGTSGDGPISFTWQKWTGSGWQNLGAPSANTLRFNDVTAAVAGRYRCVVGNSVSSAASQSATVTVLESVRITRSPSSRTAEAGDSVSFSLSAEGDNLQYEWTKDGQVIPGTGTSLSFASVRELDEGNYGCRVYNAGGSARCDSFSLTVQSPVAITTQPSDQSTYEGGSVILSVVATGDPEPSIDWLFNGSVVGTGASLALNNISPQQAGQYTCQVSNGISSVTCNPVTVSVSDGVRITSQPGNTQADEGASLSLRLEASGDNLSYEWRKDGQSLGVNSATLSLSDLAASDAGTYSCRVWNDHSSADCNSFSISINGRVAITNQPSGASAYEDESVTLTVAHNGGSDTRVTWYFSDTEVAADTDSLTLNPLTMDQAGQYRCVVANAVNSVACNAVTVSVLEKVRITKQPASQMLSVGDSFVLDIAASGNGPLQYTCYHNGTLWLTGSDPGALVISSVAATDEGDYHCVVSNAGSEATSQSASLTVMDIEARTLLITWQAPDSRADGSILDPLDIQGYKVYARAADASTFELKETTTGTATEAIIELAPGVYLISVSTVDTTGLESDKSSAYQITVN